MSRESTFFIPRCDDPDDIARAFRAVSLLLDGIEERVKRYELLLATGGSASRTATDDTAAREYALLAGGPGRQLAAPDARMQTWMGL